MRRRPACKASLAFAQSGTTATQLPLLLLSNSNHPFLIISKMRMQISDFQNLNSARAAAHCVQASLAGKCTLCLSFLPFIEYHNIARSSPHSFHATRSWHCTTDVEAFPSLLRYLALHDLFASLLLYLLVCLSS